MTLPYRDPVTGLHRSEIRHPDGSPPDPGGCRWCGRLPSVHWGAVRGVICCACEEWTPPTDAQIRARICAASERVRAQLAVPPPWPVMPRPTRRVFCGEMNHDGRGRQVFCDIEDPGHQTDGSDHDAGDGFTWPRED